MSALTASNPRRAAVSRRRPMSRRWRLALRLGLPALLLALLGGGTAAAWSSGWLGGRLGDARDAVLALSARSGFGVQEVVVTGRAVTDADTILAALDTHRGDPILAFDPEAARDRINQLTWVADSTVQRRLPDTLVVRLTERRPLAIWQNEQRLRVVDAEGAVLAESSLWRFRHLPMIVGADAPAEAPALLAMLRAEPAIAEHVVASIRVGGRRWELELDSGVRVQLPEQGAAEALRRLASAEESSRVLERDIVAIDLRMPDRLVLRLSPAANERRRLPQEAT